MSTKKQYYEEALCLSCLLIYLVQSNKSHLFIFHSLRCGTKISVFKIFLFFIMEKIKQKFKHVNSHIMNFHILIPHLQQLSTIGPLSPSHIIFSFYKFLGYYLLSNFYSRKVYYVDIEI